MPKKFAKLSRVYGTKKRSKTNIEWTYDAEEPNACCANGCHEDMNGIYYAKIRIGRAEFWINACEKCKRKAGEIK
jgi:hypothetical protein